MSHPSLRLAAARFVLQLATTEELIDAAHEALNDSVYSYSLGELATFREPTESDVYPLFVSSLRELDVAMPPLEGAADTLLCVLVGAIAEGSTTPRKGVDELHSIHQSINYSISPEEPSPELVQQFRPFESLNYAYDQLLYYEAYPETFGQSTERDQQLNELDERCVHLARKWCQDRWRSYLDSAWLTFNVLALARGINEDRAFDRLPILVDALQEAGCENDDILDHCRRSRTHHQWCWVIDLLLNKG